MQYILLEIIFLAFQVFNQSSMTSLQRRLVTALLRSIRVPLALGRGERRDRRRLESAVLADVSQGLKQPRGQTITPSSLVQPRSVPVNTIRKAARGVLASTACGHPPRQTRWAISSMPIRDCPATSLAPLKMPERESCLFSQLHSQKFKDTTPIN